MLSGGLKLNLDMFSYITFHGDYTRQMPYQQLIAGGMYSRKIGDEDVPTYTIHGGMFIRYQDAVIPVVKMDYYPFLAVFQL